MKFPTSSKLPIELEVVLDYVKSELHPDAEITFNPVTIESNDPANALPNPPNFTASYYFGNLRVTAQPTGGSEQIGLIVNGSGSNVLNFSKNAYFAGSAGQVQFDNVTFYLENILATSMTVTGEDSGNVQFVGYQINVQ